MLALSAGVLALQPTPPFRVVNVSLPFRFKTLKDSGLYAQAVGMISRTKGAASVNDHHIQFASGLVLKNSMTLRISYGASDCLSATRDISVLDVAAQLARTLHVLEL